MEQSMFVMSTIGTPAAECKSCAMTIDPLRHPQKYAKSDKFHLSIYYLFIFYLYV